MTRCSVLLLSLSYSPCSLCAKIFVNKNIHGVLHKSDTCTCLYAKNVTITNFCAKNVTKYQHCAKNVANMCLIFCFHTAINQRSLLFLSALSFNAGTVNICIGKVKSDQVSEGTFLTVRVKMCDFLVTSLPIRRPLLGLKMRERLLLLLLLSFVFRQIILQCFLFKLNYYIF